MYTTVQQAGDEGDDLQALQPAAGGGGGGDGGGTPSVAAVALRAT